MVCQRGAVIMTQITPPLPAWQDRAAKQALLQFVAEVTTPGTPTFVAHGDRIAVFDNDGTLWAEQPLYFQLAFALDQVKALAPSHPEWQTQFPFSAVLDGDLQAALAGGEQALLELVMATHGGNTPEEFTQTVKDWLATAVHPTTGRPYTAMVYQPMLELLAYLRAHGFKTYLASGGGIEFMRVFSEALYGIPPEQVIGSSVKTQLEWRNGTPVLVRLPEVNFIDDKAGKPIAIHQYIGRRPIAAFGNSDGDLPMLQWTTAGPGPRLGMLIHHTDAEREWAYDRQSPIGGLDQALSAAPEQGWVVVDMRHDWTIIFADESCP
jgi:phosphoserine phosphatase